MTPPVRTRALFVVAAFAASLVMGLVLIVAFDADVQTIDAGELVERKDDARAFLIADYLFIVLYAIVSPIAQRRFGPTGWLRWAPFLLAAAGVVDAAENTLLLTATDSISEDTVDAAHALALPKVVLFVAGALLAVGILVRAIRVLREPAADAGA